MRIAILVFAGIHRYRYTTVMVVAVSVGAAVGGGMFVSNSAATPACRLAGTWNQVTDQVGSTSWAIQADGQAQESGIGNASGKATLSNGVLTIAWTTSNGYAGTYRWTLQPDCSGTGQLTFTKVGPGDDRAGKSYASRVTGPAPTGSSSGCGADPLQCAAVVGISGEVFVRANDGRGPLEPLKPGAKLGKHDEVITGVGSTVRLKFADGTIMEVSEMTELLVADLLVKGSREAVTVQLKIGEVSAHVNPKKAFQTDFKVTVSQGVTSVRDTVLSVFYDPSSKTMIESTREGAVSVDPVGSGLATTLVPAGKEVQVTPTTISPLARIGQAGARDGVNSQTARGLVLRKLRAVVRRCRLTTPPSPSAIAIAPATKGWLVTVTVGGKVKGRTSWTVTRGTAQPKNLLAKKVSGGCR